MRDRTRETEGWWGRRLGRWRLALATRKQPGNLEAPTKTEARPFPRVSIAKGVVPGPLFGSVPYSEDRGRPETRRQRALPQRAQANWHPGCRRARPESGVDGRQTHPVRNRPACPNDQPFQALPPANMFCVGTGRTQRSRGRAFANSSATWPLLPQRQRRAQQKNIQETTNG